MNILLRFRLLTLSAAVTFALGAGAFAMQTEPLTVKTGNGDVAFTVEIAATHEERERGLMEREELAEDRGMLFLFSPPMEIRMWMKNTPLSLDMFFIDTEGTVIRIEENATPYSTDIIHSGGVVGAVLEVPGGTAKRIGAKAGDKISSVSLGNEK
jgi:uncharacterized protein